MPKWVSGYMSAAVVVLILAGIWVENSLYHVPAGDADPYHERVRAAAKALPYQQGLWVGTDVPVPPAAVALLKPNVLMNRQYRHTRTGQRVSFLLVQCGDARDILGHYPPVCYVTHGWLSVSAQPRKWVVDGLEISGMVYEFARSSFDRSSAIVIYNFMLLPDGTVAPDMAAVNRVSQDYRRKFYGAAQIQLVFDGSVPEAEREKIMVEMLTSHRNLLEVIREGIRA